MQKELLFIHSKLSNPYENLSIEHKLIEEIKPNQVILLVYSNEPSVVMGRFQNPWLECDVNKIYQDKVHMVRRQSGGGCVYHDLGNLNFCFIHPQRELQKESNNQIIIKTLRSFDIKAFASGRSDLLVDDHKTYKFSGSAFKQKKDRSFHHGTLLINSDLKALNTYLKPSKLQIEGSKSIKSNPSEVINLSQLNSEVTQNNLINVLKKSFADFYQSEVQNIVLDSRLKGGYFKTLTSWEWMWGETPQFILSYQDIKCVIKKGVILSVDNDEASQFYQGKKLSFSDFTSITPSESLQGFHQFLSSLIYS